MKSPVAAPYHAGGLACCAASRPSAGLSPAGAVLIHPLLLLLCGALDPRVCSGLSCNKPRGNGADADAASAGWLLLCRREWPATERAPRAEAPPLQTCGERWTSATASATPSKASCMSSHAVVIAKQVTAT